VTSEHDFSAAEIVDLLSRLVHREILKVAALIGIAFGAFFLTRVIAANNRATALEDARIWYERGQHQISEGRIDDAINSFRHARLNNRQERSYSLALARGYAANRDTASAHNALLGIHRVAPEDAAVNLALARLAAERRDTAEAVRYYQYTLYAPATAAQPERRRRVRLEMVRFLLTQASRDRAIPELIALSTDLPDDPAARLEVAGLFAQAGDHQRALQHFQTLLRRTPQNQAALAGAARSAFALGEYTVAVRYVRRLAEPAADIAEMRAIADWVLAHDPLAARIAARERSRRLRDNFAIASARLDACIADPATADDAQATSLAAEAALFESRLTAANAGTDAVLDAGVNLIERMERRAIELCPPGTTRDQALILIGERHRAESP
jgi:thioredoxin-like negative regulator of GroEL